MEGGSEPARDKWLPLAQLLDVNPMWLIFGMGLPEHFPARATCSGGAAADRSDFMAHSAPRTDFCSGRSDSGDGFPAHRRDRSRCRTR